jgi:putative thiamine transport system substrate-binding protein
MMTSASGFKTLVRSSPYVISPLPAAQQAWFQPPTQSHPSAQMANQESSPALGEQDPSWTKVIATQWLQRYGVMR